MGREITEHELRSETAALLTAIDAGESFVITRDSEAVAELIPHQSRRYVSADVLMAAFRTLPPIDAEQFRSDVDERVDQDATPGG